MEDNGVRGDMGTPVLGVDVGGAAGGPLVAVMVGGEVDGLIGGMIVIIRIIGITIQRRPVRITPTGDVRVKRTMSPVITLNTITVTKLLERSNDQMSSVDL